MGRAPIAGVTGLLQCNRRAPRPAAAWAAQACPGKALYHRARSQGTAGPDGRERRGTWGPNGEDEVNGSFGRGLQRSTKHIL